VLSDIDRAKDVALVYRRGADDKPNEKDTFILSARCRDGLDLARQLCVAYGGNGHGAAAGCRMTRAELDALLGVRTVVIGTSD
jgi:nanoRNase/pAp phosphatase (c-di-AMP/oligoRNAs hydrolase)